ncbi:hypothetical protein WL40_25500 [Burkholderia ubonensis]|uniref:Uncharacterized protein n=1 Tax=Burkholderia ubonensis TaxID=101571 RepID=A0ABD4DV42_9BURK|nr:hypothetical protein WJ68_23930 [Burkholderia ubonensis]KVO10641.1 hypothetical protein WJ72_19895 [Burkholderia ubonensis]KVO18219.1 hypothetical protein WJ74_07175 [Burkholderia ubonensis]KVP80353.1 hypothetical protein WJ92_18450 [Burkholderia ubonensis]KVR08766.1 hypothetical protein WK11_07970 [Burkholderia ubonensis]
MRHVALSDPPPARARTALARAARVAVALTIALTRATIDSRRESLRIFRRRHDEGAISRLDLTQSEILLQQAESLGAQLGQARASAADALMMLVGASPDLPATPPTLDDEAVMPALAPGLPFALLENRPDVIAAEHQLRAAAIGGVLFLVSPKRFRLTISRMA